MNDKKLTMVGKSKCARVLYEQRNANHERREV